MLCRILPYANQAGVRVSVISVPKAPVAVPQAICYQFDSSGGVGDEDQVKIIRAGVEKAQSSQSRIFYPSGRQL